MKYLKLEILKKIIFKIREAEEFFLEDNFETAIKKYKEALDIIPESRYSWNESWSFFYGISEMYFQYGHFEEALDYLEDCIKCPHAIGNPHVHLRIGQIRYELNQVEKAKDELIRAYMGGDFEIFENEPKKYLDLIKSYINKKE